MSAGLWLAKNVRRLAIFLSETAEWAPRCGMRQAPMARRFAREIGWMGAFGGAFVPTAALVLPKHIRGAREAR